MSNEKFKIPRTSDKHLIEVIREMAKQFGMLRATFSGMTGINFEVDLVDDTPNEQLNQFLALDSHLIERAHTTHHDLTISYLRGGGEQSPAFDEVHINFVDGRPAPSVQERLAILAFLVGKLKRVELGRVTPADLAPDIQHILAVHQSNLQRLEGLNEDLIARSSAFREDLERRFTERVTANEATVKEKKEDLEKQAQKAAEAIEIKEQNLAVRLAAVDASDNTFARRKIRDSMLEDVKTRIQNFGVSKATEHKRRPVQMAIFMLLGVISFFLLISLFDFSRQEPTSSSAGTASFSTPKTAASSPIVNPAGSAAAVLTDSPANYWQLGRIALLTLSLFATIIYYIKWQQKWAEHHAASEFHLQQFYIDVNRANWVIESCLEWRNEKDGTEIPPTLLSSITNGLFVNVMSEPERVIHPADELASALLGSASKLKLRVGDNEIDFDKPKTIPK